VRSAVKNQWRSVDGPPTAPRATTLIWVLLISCSRVMTARFAPPCLGRPVFCAAAVRVMQFGHNSGCVARADESFCQALDTPSRRPPHARTAEIEGGQWRPRRPRRPRDEGAAPRPTPSDPRTADRRPRTRIRPSDERTAVGRAHVHRTRAANRRRW